MISVIMPLYNNEKYVKEAIDSVLAQTYTDWELIIINDASTDNSKDIVENIIHGNDKIKFINLTENKGVSFARNLGIKESKGEYISFLDSDDLWNKECLDSLYKKIKKENKHLVYGKFSYLYSKKHIVINNTKMKDGNICNFIVRKNHRYETEYSFHVCCILIEKYIINKYNIDFPEDQNLFEDGLFIAKILCITETTFVDKVLMYYRQHKNSVTHKKYAQKEYIQELLYLERLILFSKKYNRNAFMLLNKLYIYRVYRVVLCISKLSYVDISIKFIDKYKNILMKFINDDYYKWNDRIKCKLLLSKNKYIINFIRNI